MNVAIFGRKVTKQNAEYYVELFKILKDFGWNPVVHSALQDKLIKKVGIAENCDSFSSHVDFQSGIDLSLSMGGDGTFIQNVKFVRNSQVPILGINTGRLGFLANISKENIEQAMDLVKRKEFEHQSRSLIRVETERNLFGEDNVAFNEVTLQKRETASMITVHASLEGKYLNLSN